MKKLVSIVLACALALSMSVFAADFKDMPNDWSTEALNAAVKNGLLTGSDGYIKASDNMTRAEMATIMVRACGAVKEADISAFSDVKESDWFYSSMAKAVQMGAFKGSDGKLNPNSPITRQEAFLVLSRIFGLDTNIKISEKDLDSFKDKDKVADWALAGVGAIIKRGYVGGSNGNLNPLSNITRAEFAVVMDRLVKYYIDSPDQEIPTDGNVMIRFKTEKIENLKTDKMVILGDAVDTEKVLLTGCDIENLVLRCQGAATLEGKFKNLSVLSPIQVSGNSNNMEKIYICKGSNFREAAMFIQ